MLGFARGELSERLVWGDAWAEAGVWGVQPQAPSERLFREDAWAGAGSARGYRCQGLVAAENLKTIFHLYGFWFPVK